MKQNSKKLMTILLSALFVVAAVVVLYETNILLEGTLTGNANTEFLVLMFMELLTVCVIPLALRMFRFSKVRTYIKEKGAEGHFRMALIRMMMLVLPLIVNIMCYYLFMKVAFAYLTVILAISLVFIIPTKARCESEQ